MDLELLADTFVICRLDGTAAVPDWAQGDFVSITRTADELSIVCRQELVPGEAQAERDWRCLRVAGKLDFSLVGILASLTKILAEANISVFVVSTYDTDYLLVKATFLEEVVAALTNAGHSVQNQ